MLPPTACKARQNSLTVPFGRWTCCKTCHGAAVVTCQHRRRDHDNFSPGWFREQDTSRMMDVLLGQGFNKHHPPPPPLQEMITAMSHWQVLTWAVDHTDLEGQIQPFTNTDNHEDIHTHPHTPPHTHPNTMAETQKCTLEQTCTTSQTQLTAVLTPYCRMFIMPRKRCKVKLLI